jgi:hypothetical protein
MSRAGVVELVVRLVPEQFTLFVPPKQFTLALEFELEKLGTT